LLLIWNLGHKRGAKKSLMVKGKRKLLSPHACVIGAGLGIFLGLSQRSRAFILEMKPYTAETKPEREFDEDDTGDLDKVYVYLRYWTGRVKLNRKPPLPSGVLRRSADNVRGLLAVADACGPEWERRAREALTFLLEKEKAERPQVLILRHGLEIFERLGVEQISSIEFNKELRKLDLPDARWTRYCGPSGLEFAHPIELFEQAALLRALPSNIHSVKLWPPGKREAGGCFHGYKRNHFVEALRRYTSSDGKPLLRLVTPTPD
jgi:hypothetical protein